MSLIEPIAGFEPESVDSQAIFVWVSSAESWIFKLTKFNQHTFVFSLLLSMFRGNEVSDNEGGIMWHNTCQNALLQLSNVKRWRGRELIIDSTE